MAHKMADGTIKQPNRNWYTLRETLEIYEQGGQIILTLKSEQPEARRNGRV